MAKRQIEPKMVAWIDKKLALNGAAQEAILKKDARSVFAYAIESCVGIREEGDNRGPLVSLIQDTIDGPDHVAWCMSFMQTGLAYAELKTGVKSPIAVTEHCLTCWEKTPKVQRVKTFPLRGAIVIYQHGTSDAGHTGMFQESPDAKNLHAIEGNTGSGVGVGGEIERDGDGVYRTFRSLKGTGSMKLIGFLKPF